MGKISQYGKPHAVRFKKKNEKELTTFCIEHELNESSVIQAAVACFLANKSCKARKKVL